jgi:hypothetical protein
MPKMGVRERGEVIDNRLEWNGLNWLREGSNYRLL